MSQAAAVALPPSYSAVAAAGVPASSASHPGRVAANAGSGGAGTGTGTGAGALPFSIVIPLDDPQDRRSYDAATANANSSDQPNERLVSLWERACERNQLTDEQRRVMRASIIDYLNSGELVAIPLITVRDEDVVPCAASVASPTMPVACSLCTASEPRIMSVEPPHHVLPYSHAWYVRAWLRNAEGLDAVLRYEPVQSQEQHAQASLSSSWRARNPFRQHSEQRITYAWVIYAVRGAL